MATSNMLCWKCKKSLPEEKIAFRATCLKCGCDLHTCTGCRYYSPGKPNDCIVPGTESIRDREASNLCEEFKIKLDMGQEKTASKSKFNSLFKED